jgi:hypothetical protein
MTDAPDWFAPGGTLALLLSAVAFLTREWRMGREASVDYHRRRAEVAEKARDEIEHDLSDRLHEVQKELEAVRSELRAMRREHTAELAAYSERTAGLLAEERKRTERELMRAFHYREALSAQGIDPDQIDARWADQNPQLRTAEES